MRRPPAPQVGLHPPSRWPGAETHAVAQPAFGRDFSDVPVHPPVDVTSAAIRPVPHILRQAGGRCACGGVAGPDGECTACRSRRLAREQRMGAPEISGPLVSQPGDAVEQEADRIAALVDQRERRPPIAGAGPVVPVMRSAATAAPRPVPSPVAATIRTAGRGEPLDRHTQSAVEDALGTSLAAVRIHTGSEAAESARALDARAYAVGDHVVFGRGAYAPHTPSGRRLLAHELVHVVQSRRAAAPPHVLRQACGHDGRAAECGGGAFARWRLVDVAGAVTDVALDELIVGMGLRPLFGGTWVTQVTTPPNPYKAGVDRGRVDGMKVALGSTLGLEVVEIKSRATQFQGGCALATREAQGYVQVLRRIAPKVVEISRGLASIGGLRVGDSITAADRRRLSAAGIDSGDPLTLQALRFYQSLQNRLGQALTTPLTAMTVAVNADGTANTSYPVYTALVDCRTRRRRSGVRTRQLGFQVNRAGGVSYGCENGPCEGEEEERQRQRQVQQQPQAQTSSQPAEQPRAQRRDDAEEGDERPGTPSRTPPHDPVLPVIVGVGAGVGAIGAGAAAVARARARQIAAREAAELAARQALQAAWRRQAEEATARRLARQGLGKAAGKAAVYAEVAAAAALVLFYSDRAEARVGPGESPIESLYKAMTASGHPPSKELRDLIESDPVLKELAERAGQSGDPSALQEAATRRVMELVRDHPGEFSPEDLEMLARFSQTSRSGGQGPQTAEQLRAAIDAARRQQAGGVAGPTGSGGQGSGTGDSRGTPARPTTPRGRDAGTGTGPAGPRGAAPDAAGALPNLTPEGRAMLPPAGSPVRTLFDAMVGRSGTGVSVTDDAVKRFIATVPFDLTATETAALVRQLRPTESETLDEVLSRLSGAIASLRSNRQPDPARAGGQISSPSRPAAPAPAPRQATGPATTPGTPTPRDASPRISQDEYIGRATAAIGSWNGWGGLSPNRFRFVASGDRNWRTAPVGSRLDGWAYIIIPTQTGNVRAAAFVSMTVTGHRGPTATARVTSAGSLVHDDRTTQTAFQVGEIITVTEPE